MFIKSTPTVGAEWGSFSVGVEEEKYKFNILDCSGQSRFSDGCKASLAMRVDEIIFLVFDVNNKKSFYELHNWLDPIGESNRKAKLVLVANKMDEIAKDSTKREVSRKDVDKLLINNTALQLISYIECSATDNLVSYICGFGRKLNPNQTLLKTVCEIVNHSRSSEVKCI